MAIVWGNNSYTLKSFTPAELGIFNADVEKYEFKIIQKYFHLYWIPVVSTGVAYTMGEKGKKEKYHAPPEIESAMRLHHIPAWHHAGAFALPLLFVLGFTFVLVTNYFDQKRSSAAYSARMEATKKVKADTLALKPYAAKIIAISDIIDKHYTKEEKISKIDTSQMKVFIKMIEALASVKDTSVRYNKSNTIIYIQPKDLTGEIGLGYKSDEVTVSAKKTRNLNLFPNYSDENRVINWYANKMQESSENSNFDADDISRTNIKINNLKYIALVNHTGFAKPTFFDKNSKHAEGYSSGYISAKVAVYDLENAKIVENIKVLASNSETIKTFSRKNEDYNKSSIESSLQSDLEQNFAKEIRYSLRIEKRPVENK